MSLDAKRCAELLAICERATPPPWTVHNDNEGMGPSYGPLWTVYDENFINPPDEDSACLELQLNCGTESDAIFIASAHDLADQLRDALSLLSECRELAYNLQNEHPALSDLLDKLNEAGIE